MVFTFIIVTLNNRNEQLQSCISSVEDAHNNQGNIEIEILVVFQGANEYNANPVIKYPRLTKFYYIEKKGLSYARNYAIKKSRGDVFIFLDDDAQVEKNFLRVLSDYAQHCPVTAFCGRIIDPKTNKCYTVNFLDEKERFLKRREFTYFMGSAHVLKKESLEKIGFYDESFGAGGKFHGAEESDIFFRLKRQGIKIKYVPQLIFYHPISYSPEYSKVFDYSYAVGAMLSKQVFSDRKHSLTYLLIAAEFFLKSFLRSIQKYFVKSITKKDKRFHYTAAFTGLAKGFLCYIKDKVYAHRN